MLPDESDSELQHFLPTVPLSISALRAHFSTMSFGQSRDSDISSQDDQPCSKDPSHLIFHPDAAKPYCLLLLWT